MTQEMDLRKLERKAWLSFHSDGLWDMFFGSLMLIMGAHILTGTPWIALLLIAAICFGFLGKRFITEPRMGHVKFGSNRSKRFMRVLIINIVVCVIIAAVIAPALLGAPIPKEVRLITLMIGGLIVFSGIAYIFDFKRMYIYVVLFIGGLTLFDLFGDIRGAFLLTAAGFAVMVVGLVFLARFLKKYPLPQQEEPNDT